MIIFFLALTVVVAIIFFTSRSKAARQNETSRKSIVLKTFGIIFVGVIISFVQPFAVERVDAGHVGIKVNLTGDDRGVSQIEYKTGWVVYNTWVSDLYEFPTFQQHIDYNPQSVITKGGFNATIKPSFNYTVKPGAVGDMFQNLRRGLKEIENEWLGNAILSSINDVTNRWSVDDIFNKREQFEADIVIEANKRVAKWFTISQLRTNIEPPEALKKSIEEKTQAIQNVQVAENQRLVAIAEGDKKIAQARADSAAAVIAAAGEAEAIRRKQISLNAQYIEYMKINKWDGKLPQVQSGNAGILLNLPKE